MLKNPVYIGKVRCKGQVFEGKHEPIIDQATWEQVQAVGAARSTRRGSSASTVVKSPAASLVDLAYCAACGARMWFQPLNATRKYAYYLCADRATGGQCRARMVRADIVDQALLNIIRILAVPEAWRDAIVARAASLATEQKPVKSDNQAAIERALRTLRLDFADECIDETTYWTLPTSASTRLPICARRRVCLLKWGRKKQSALHRMWTP
jgi:hypothetical protein